MFALPLRTSDRAHPPRSARLPRLLAASLLGALSVGGLGAQSYSESFGFLRMRVGPGLALLSNPVHGGVTNHLNDLIPLDDATGIGTTVWRFDDTAQAYGAPIQFLGNTYGWVSSDPNPDWPQLEPGEAFFLEALQPVTVSFVGPVTQGTLTGSVRGGNSYSIQASPAAQSAPIGHLSDGAGPAVGLLFPASPGDQLFVFDTVTQRFKETYVYSFNNLGWLSTNTDDPGPNGPVIPMGSGFFAYKAGATRVWTQRFDVNSATLQ